MLLSAVIRHFGSIICQLRCLRVLLYRIRILTTVVMADSKLKDDQGVMVAAMAYRVKYRKHLPDGSFPKVPVRVETMGVHKMNRGGVYPSGVRCRSLCQGTFAAGFVKEELSHACIAVEEVPVDEIIRSRGPHNPHMVSASTYNAEQTAKDELLATCFVPPYDDVRYMLLSHNHMMLIVRAFLSGAKWDLPETANGIKICDGDGRLSVTVVTGFDNGKELGEVIADGIPTEILSWKMDVEEPNAASLISQALNSPHELGMRTTELTAVAVLKGEIIVQMGKDLSQRVAFKTVRDRVRTQLQAATDDPDLPEVFEFLISNGVGKNVYIDKLLEWTQTFVDSKKRQLRFSAFAPVNKMCAEAVWARMAVVKRAYRKPPTAGFCPSPEPLWGDISWTHMQRLEELLRFFHVSCKDNVDSLAPQSRIQLMGNIDITAAEAFIMAYDTKSKSKPSDSKIKEALLGATKKYLEPLGLGHWDIVESTMGEGRADWICFKKDEAPSPDATDAATTSPIKSATTVIQFDEVSGKPLNKQVSFTVEENEEKKKDEPSKLPWREWLGGCGSTMGNKQADMASAVAALHCVHTEFRVANQPVEVWLVEGHTRVTATSNVTAGELMLPPCNPHKMCVHETSVHPFAAEITMSVMKSTEKLLEPSQKKKNKKKT